MAGIVNEVIYGINADFSKANNPSASESNGLITDGQLWIGSTAANVGGTHITVGHIVAGTGMSVTNGPGIITITNTMSGSSVLTLTGNTGGAVSATANNINVTTSGQGLTFTTAGATPTLSLKLTDGSDNIFLGRVSGKVGNTATNNVGVGAGTFQNVTSAANNCAFGYASFNQLTSGQFGVAVGTNAAANMTTENSTCAVGYQALSGSTGRSNCAIGYQALVSLGAGIANCALGTLAGSAYTTTDSSNIVIRHTGVVGESNVMRLGTPGTSEGQVSSCYVAGITGVTVASSAVVGVNSSGQLSSLLTGSSGQVLKSTGTTSPTWQALPPQIVFNKPSDFDALETNFAPLTQINGSNVKTFVRAFDQTTVEYVNFDFQAPSDLNTGGTITFRVFMYAQTAVASRFVKLSFEHSAVSDSDPFDTAYTAVNSADIAIDATQGDITIATWTVSVSTAAWAANDYIFARLSRIAPAGTNLASDLYVLGFTVEIPRV